MLSKWNRRGRRNQVHLSGNAHLSGFEVVNTTRLAVELILDLRQNRCSIPATEILVPSHPRGPQPRWFAALT